MREAAVKQRQMMDGVKHELFDPEPASPSHARNFLANQGVEKKYNKRQQPAPAPMPAPQVSLDSAAEAKRRKVHAIFSPSLAAFDTIFQSISMWVSGLEE
jgi:hypothetical protein